MNQDLISSRYNIVRQIGQGGQGRVLLVQSLRTGETVAIKVIPVNPVNQANAIQEIQSLISIKGMNCSPYITCYKDSFYDLTTSEIVIEMNYVDGPTITEYILPLSDRNTLILLCKSLTKAMLLGLQVIHSQNIIHNDIKPSNIIVGTNRVPVLVDLGISCFTFEAVNQVCTATYGKVVGKCCNMRAGTSLYLPPESIKGVRYFASDLWSLASTVYSVITGNNIWGLNPNNFTAEQLLQQVVINFTNAVIPLKLNSGDYQLDSVINGFLVYDPLARMTIPQALAILN